MDEIEYRMATQTHMLLEQIIEELRQIKFLLENPMINVKVVDAPQQEITRF